MAEDLRPSIRFAGFTDAWEQRRLGELTSIVTGTTPSTASDGFYGGEHLFVTPGDIGNSRYICRTATTLTDAGAASSRVVPAGTTMFVCIGSTVGKTAQISFQASMNQQINAVTAGESLEPNYLYSVLEHNATSVRTLAATQAVPIVNKTIFSAIQIPVPSLPEQRRIGELFSALDSLITLHQRKLDALRNVKRSLLDKMFPREGKTVPELRFAGFTDAWEQRRLGDVAEVVMGQSPHGDCYTSDPSDFILVQGNSDLEDGWVKPRLWTTEVTKTASAGDLIMSVRAPVGAMGKTAFDVVLGRGVAGIRGDEFLYQSLCKKELDGYWSQVSAGSTFDSINGDELRGTFISLPPDTSEQRRIGALFSALDSLITLHQRKLDALRNVKRSLLDKMFV